MVNSRLKFMKEALLEAKKAYRKNEVPIGAVIVKNNRIISRAHNLVKKLKNPVAHAEILAISKAAKKLKNERLTGCALYATIEPCAMCAGALVLARVKELVFGADEPKTGGITSKFKIANSRKLNHRIMIKKGVLAGKSRELMRNFFRNKR